MLETIEPWVGQPLVEGLRQRAQLCASCLRTARRAVQSRLDMNRAYIHDFESDLGVFGEIKIIIWAGPKKSKS